MSTESDRLALFNEMRLMAMVADHLQPMRKEVEDAMWADYGRAVHAHLLDERFVQAITACLLMHDGKELPQHSIARRLRVYLTMGTISS